jgi:hypothetical protein
LTTVKNIPILWEVIDNKNFHETHLEGLFNHPCQFTEEIRKPWTTSNGEKTTEPKTKEFPPCPSSDPLCIQEVNQEDMYGLVEEGIHSGQNEEENQVHCEYIEHWFHTTIRLKHQSLLQKLSTSYHSKQLEYHALVYIKEHFSNMSLNIFVILLCTWIHWKYSNT